MFLKISSDYVIAKSDIIGVFDMDNTTVSRQGKNFLPMAEQNGNIIYSADELPKSYVVTEREGRIKVYLSSFNSKVLINRIESARFPARRDSGKELYNINERK